jgi:hypothetical protein
MLRKRVSPDRCFTSRDRLDPDSRRAARRGQSTAPVPVLDSVRSTPADRADQLARAEHISDQADQLARAERISDRAAHIDLSNAPTAAGNSAASHNHILRSATSADTPHAAGHQPSDILAAQRPTAGAGQRAAAEVLRLDIAARLVLER